MSKIYISGPMSGKKDYNYPTFNQLAEILRANGHTVFNPAEIPSPDCLMGREIWIWYMKKAITMLMKADVIVLLPGWKDSEGASLEVLIAQQLEYKIIEESELVDMGIVF